MFLRYDCVQVKRELPVLKRYIVAIFSLFYTSEDMTEREKLFITPLLLYYVNVGCDLRPDQHDRMFLTALPINIYIYICVFIVYKYIRNSVL